ncbi:site-specific DNA-methyltransferase [Candidatus Bathyarchaeota archaeon]|nr:site-specific DNA-methyltransferase [Candidatus Bathyarchaeota archaeon]
MAADLIRAGATLRKPPIYERDGIPGSGGPDWWKNRYEFVICATNGGKLPWSDNVACGHEPVCEPGGKGTYRDKNGQRQSAEKGHYRPPTLANPGNVIDCGPGGHLGSALAHENEAPFPEKLVKPFILSFCLPGGTVLDPFGGSGTVAAVAEKHGRNSISIDIRPSQVDLMHRRLREVRGTPPIPIVKEIP